MRLSEAAAANHCRMIWIRHGETTWNTEKRFQGHLDIALNQVGIEQAHLLATRLSTLKMSLKLSCLYSSDLSRAKDTAAPISERMGQAIHTKPALRERNFGVVAGMTAEEMHILHPHTAKQLHLRIPEAELPGGESLLDFHTRIIGTTCGLIKQHVGQTIVIVSHGGVIDCVRRWALNIPLQYQRDWQLPNASINVVDADNKGAEIKVWADINHLEGTI
jgi:probable phosphoglycerate mutase